MLRDLASSLLATVQTRLALLANEVQFEEQRLLHLLLRSLLMLLCAGLGLLLLLALALALWWEQRVILLSLGTALCLLAAGVLYASLRRSQRDADPIFAASLAELQEDLRQLKAASGHVPPTD